MSNQSKPVKSEGIVLWHTSMSLDGYISGPNDSMDWVFNYSYPKDEVDEVIRTTGALLVGKRSYNVGKDENSPPEAQKPYEGQWKGPQFVLTHHPPDNSNDPTITFLEGDISEAVNLALKAAAGKNVVIIGASVARQCIDAGLIDEIYIHIVPILLGDGVPLFRRKGNAKTKLKMISFTKSGQTINLRFRVVK
ncbi:MAG: dihydrofolate reductase family protein [Promethearchaeota archaeon]